MTAVSASSVRVSTLADGTLRLVVDIEPTAARDAFALFGSPGTPMALAALRQGYAAADAGDSVSVSPATKFSQETKPALGPLAKLAVQWCKDPDFWKWQAEDDESCEPVTSEAQSAGQLKFKLAINSRREIDVPSAAEYFHRLVRIPYMAYRKKRGLA